MQRPLYESDSFSMPDETRDATAGQIVEIKGVVIDAVFPDELPEINTALEIEVPTDGGREVNSGGAAASGRRPCSCSGDGLDGRSCARDDLRRHRRADLGARRGKPPSAASGT